MVAVATVTMVLGLSVLLTGVYCWRAQPPAPGGCLGGILRGSTDL